MRTLIHASANEDRWFLCHGEDVADVFILHEPNSPSGGMSERVTLAVFLARDEGSPQRQAFLGMIGSLVASTHEVRVGSVDGPEPGAAGAEPTPGAEAAAI